MEIEEKLSNSLHICRLCGQDKEKTSFILDHPIDKALPRNITFFLPIELSVQSPFPPGICSKCFQDFTIFKSFFISLNEGQAKLADLLAQKENMIIQMPNFLQRKKSLFSIKYPSVPKKKIWYKKASKTSKIEMLMKMAENVPGNSDLGPGKRTRRLPQRLAESVQGTDLEKIFKNEEPAPEVILEQNESEKETSEYNQIVTFDPSFKSNDEITTKELTHLNPDTQIEELGEMLNQLQDKTVEQFRTKTSELVGQHAKDQIVPKTKKSAKANILAKSKSRLNKNVCDICAKKFKVANRLAQHKILQHTGVFFHCKTDPCEKRFKTRDALDLHQKLALHQTGFEIVGTSSRSKPSRIVLDHQKNNSDVEETSNIEKTSNTKKISDADKMSNMDIEMRFQCGECDKIFNSKFSLESHLNEVHFSEEVFHCKLCSTDFTHRTDYKDHSFSIHGTVRDSFTCDFCLKIFYNSSSLDRHRENDHKSDLSISCSQCSRMFKSKMLLTRHNSIVHSDSNLRPFACTFCNMKFKSNNNLRTHMTSHSGEKRFSCESCDKQFSYKTSLMQHLKWHEGAKPFKCDHCGKGFSQNGNLQEHKRIHSGDKPFACSICHKRFTTSSQHKLHEKRHRGERPWKCNLCPKTFLNKDSWTSHLRRHKGDRPYACPDCKKTFTEIWALKKHSRLHSGEKPYCCPICSKSFSDCSNLTKHKRSHAKHHISVDFKGEHLEEVHLNSEDFGQGQPVWNVIEDTNIRTSNPNQEFVLESGVIEPSAMGCDANSEQIIYIAYDTDDKNAIVQILDQNLVENIECSATSGVTSSEHHNQDLVNLSHLSDPDRFQLTAVHPGQSASVSSQAPGSIQLPDLNAGESQDGTTGLENVLLCPDLSEISEQGQVEVEEETPGSFIDVKIKEGQIIRLKVPLNVDPVAYAAEYLQNTINEDGELP